jgi:hypothetical protein
MGNDQSKLNAYYFDKIKCCIGFSSVSLYQNKPVDKHY